MTPMFTERLFRSHLLLFVDGYRTRQITLVHREHALQALDYLCDHCVHTWRIKYCVQVLNCGSVGGH